MRKIASSVLIFVGVLALVFAGTAAFWTSDQVKKTPLDTDSMTRLEGTASLSGATSVPVKALSQTKSDSVLSTDDVVVFNGSSCLVIVKGDTPDCVEATDPEGRLLAAGSEIFATNRKTAEAVNDRSILPADAVEKRGLVNKWPFDAKKTDYTFWDNLTKTEVPAVYSSEEKLDGLTTYRYTVDIADAPIEIAEGVPGTYSSTKQIWVDPRTGSIIKQTEQQERVTDDGSPVLAVDIGFTDQQVDKNVTSAKDGISSLDLVSTTIPIGGLVLGIIALAAGIFLLLRTNRSARKASAVEH